MPDPVNNVAVDPLVKAQELYDRLRSEYAQLRLEQPDIKLPETDSLMQISEPLFYPGSTPDSFFQSFLQKQTDDRGEAGTRGFGNMISAFGEGLRGLNLLGIGVSNRMNPLTGLGVMDPIDPGDSPVDDLGKLVQGKGEEITRSARPATGSLARPAEGLSEYLDPQRALMTIQEQGPQMAAMMAATLANPIAGTIMMGSVEGGNALSEIESFEAQTGEKMDDHTKLLTVAGVGAINAALEKTGIDRIFKAAGPGLRGALVKLMVDPVVEGSTETLQEVTHLLAEAGYKGKVDENFANRLSQSFYGGLILGGAGSAASSVAQATGQQLPADQLPEISPTIDDPSPEAVSTPPLPEIAQQQQPDASTLQESPQVAAPETLPEAPVLEKPPETKQQSDFSSTQVPLPPDLSQKVETATSSLIAPEDLHEKSKPGGPKDGPIDAPHVTIKYGLHTAFAEEVKPDVEGFGPITARVKGVEIFEPEGKDYDVVVLQMVGKRLHDLNKKITKSAGNRVTNTFPTYKPHITLAYVKKGTGQKYANLKTGIEGENVRFDQLQFAGKMGDVVTFNLSAKPTSSTIDELLQNAETKRPPEQKEIRVKHDGPKTVRSWMRANGIKLHSSQIAEYGFGKGSRENKSLMLQIGGGKHSVDDVALQAISAGIIPPPPADTNPADHFMQLVKANATTVDFQESEAEAQMKAGLGIYARSAPGSPDNAAKPAAATNKPPQKKKPPATDKPVAKSKPPEKPELPLHVGQASGMPKKPKKLTKSDYKDAVTLRQIGEHLARSMDYTLGQNVRTGLIRRFTRRALGLYFLKSGIIRVNSLTDIETLAHEFGHMLDEKVFHFSTKLKIARVYRSVKAMEKIADPVKRAQRKQELEEQYGIAPVQTAQHREIMRRELLDFLVAIDYPDSDNLKEGVAEFVNYYVTKSKQAKQFAPTFYEFFEQMLQANENIEIAVKTAQEMYQRFDDQDPRIKARVSKAKTGEPTSTLQSLTLAGKTWYANIIDGSSALRKLEKELRKKRPDLPGVENPLQQVLSLAGVHGKLEAALNHGLWRRRHGGVEIIEDSTPLIGTRKEPGIIHKILRDGRLDEFEDYLIVRRNVELHKNGKGAAATMSKMESLEAIKSFESFNDDFADTAKAIYEFQNWALEYYAHSGKLSAEQVKIIKQQNNYYIPFKRYFAEWETGNFEVGEQQILRDTSSQVVQRIEGGRREIISPIAAVIENTYQLIKNADQNYALQTLIDAFDAIDPSIAQEIPAELVVPVSVLPTNDEDGPQIRYQVKTEKPTEGNIVSVYREGKVKFYDLPKDYYDSIFTLYAPIDKAIQVLAIPSNILRAGAVRFDPTFAVRNVPRDQVSAIFYSKYGYNPFHFLQGMSNAFKKTETYKKFLMSGADQSFLTVVAEQIEKAGKYPSFNKNLESRWTRYRNPFFFFEDINRASEIGTRVGAFANALRKTDDVYAAMQEAREIGGDYAMKGVAMRNVIPLFPFLNARIQHMKQTAISAKRSPGKFVAKGLMYVTAPTIVNYFLNHEDDEVAALYAELPDWRKVSFFNIHIPGTDQFWPVPKGALGILFGTTTEYFLDYLRGEDPEYLGEMSQSFFKDFLPIASWQEIMPQFARPIMEQTFNKIAYTGRPIVPQRLEKLALEAQYTDQTSEVAKKIGSIFGWSPLRIQHFVTSWTAGTGRGFLYSSDEILGLMRLVPVKSDDTWTRMGRLPFLRGLVTSSPIGSRSRSVQEFYGLLDDVDMVNRTVNGYVRDNDDDQAARFLAERPEYKAMYNYYRDNKKEINRFRRELWKLRGMLNEIQSSKEPQAKKVQAKRVLEIQFTKRARTFLDAYAKELFQIKKVK